MLAYCIFEVNGDNINILAKAKQSFDHDELIKLFSLPRAEIIHHGYYINGQKHQVYVVSQGYLQGRTESLQSGFLAFHRGNQYSVVQYDYPIIAPEAGAALVQKMVACGMKIDKMQ